MRRVMMTSGLSAMAVALLLAVSGPAGAQQSSDNGWYGRGMMGPGMGPGMMMGPGMGSGMMMGPGMMGQGMMGHGMMYPGMMGPGTMMWGYGWQQRDLDLSVDDVETSLDNWMKMMGNPNIKLGRVAEKDDDTITAEIVTTDNEGLVQRFDIDRHSGMWMPAR